MQVHTYAGYIPEPTQIKPWSGKQTREGVEWRPLARHFSPFCPTTKHVGCLLHRLSIYESDTKKENTKLFSTAFFKM